MGYSCRSRRQPQPPTRTAHRRRALGVDSVVPPTRLAPGRRADLDRDGRARMDPRRPRPHRAVLDEASGSRDRDACVGRRECARPTPTHGPLPRLGWSPRSPGRDLPTASETQARSAPVTCRPRGWYGRLRRRRHWRRRRRRVDRAARQGGDTSAVAVAPRGSPRPRVGPTSVQALVRCLDPVALAVRTSADPPAQRQISALSEQRTRRRGDSPHPRGTARTHDDAVPSPDDTGDGSGDGLCAARRLRRRRRRGPR